MICISVFRQKRDGVKRAKKLSIWEFWAVHNIPSSSLVQSCLSLIKRLINEQRGFSYGCAITGAFGQDIQQHPRISLGILGLSFIKHVTSVFLFQWYTQISHRISFQKCHITDQNRQIYMYYYKIFCIPKSSMLKLRLLLCEQIVKIEVWTLLGIRISTSGIVKFSIWQRPVCRKVL